jgi:hypothetical protein
VSRPKFEPSTTGVQIQSAASRPDCWELLFCVTIKPDTGRYIYTDVTLYNGDGDDTMIKMGARQRGMCYKIGTLTSFLLPEVPLIQKD